MDESLDCVYELFEVLEKRNLVRLRSSRIIEYWNRDYKIAMLPDAAVIPPKSVFLFFLYAGEQGDALPEVERGRGGRAGVQPAHGAAARRPLSLRRELALNCNC